jgi:signal transduction histidine kinase
VRTGHCPRRSRFTISVLDDGAGISRENRRRLFTEFFTTKGGRGTGLGLPVTRKLVTEMGGAITCHSVERRGTRFVVALPLVDAPPKTEEECS